MTGCVRCADLTRSPWRRTTVKTWTPVGESKHRTHCPIRTRGWASERNQFDWHSSDIRVLSIRSIHVFTRLRSGYKISKHDANSSFIIESKWENKSQSCFFVASTAANSHSTVLSEIISAQEQMNRQFISDVCAFVFSVIQRCEKLTLLLYSHTLSAPFHEPVSPLVSPTDLHWNLYSLIL